MTSDTYILYFSMSVRPSVNLSVPLFSKTSSNRPIFKILFLLKRYDIRLLSFVLLVCLSVRPSVRPYHPSPKRVLTVRFLKFFFCWKGMTSDFYLLYFLSVCPSVPPFFKTSSNRPIFKILFLLARYDIRHLSFVLFVCLSVRLSVRITLLQNEF